MTRRQLLKIIAIILPFLRKLFDDSQPELAAQPFEMPWRKCPCQGCVLMRRRLLLKVLQEKGQITLNTTGDS